MIAYTRIAECKALLQKHRVDATARPQQLAHTGGPEQAVFFNTLADQPFDLVCHDLAMSGRCVKLRFRAYQSSESRHVADAICIQAHALILPYDFINRMTDDVKLLCDLAL